MIAKRQYAVDHLDWVATAQKLEGSHPPDPKPGEEKLVCTRCHSVGTQGTQIVLEAIYEEATPLVLTIPPPPVSPLRPTIQKSPSVVQGSSTK